MRQDRANCCVCVLRCCMRLLNATVGGAGGDCSLQRGRLRAGGNHSWQGAGWWSRVGPTHTHDSEHVVHRVQCGIQSSVGVRKGNSPSLRRSPRSPKYRSMNHSSWPGPDHAAS